jgi:hypothetical protein
MTFVKGESGNPQGRKVEKVAKEIVEKLGLGPKAIKILGDLMENSEDDRVRADCAKYLADRQYGKPRQAVDVGGQQDNPIKMVHKVTISLLE